MDTIDVTIPINTRKNAERLSILNLKLTKGRLLFILKEIVCAFAVNNLHVIDTVSKLPDTREKVLDKKFDIFGLKHVINEDIDPPKYKRMHIIKLVVK